MAQSLFAVLIHGGVFLLWIGSFARAFVLRGLVAWSVGIAFAGFLQTQYWNRDMTGNRRYGALGLLMMPVKAIDTVQPIYGLTAFAL